MFFLNWKYAADLQENTYAKVKSHFGIVLSCRYAAYFQHTFLKEYLWVAASWNKTSTLKLFTKKI